MTKFIHMIMKSNTVPLTTEKITDIIEGAKSIETYLRDFTGQFANGEFCDEGSVHEALVTNLQPHFDLIGIRI